MALHVLDEANRCLGCKKPMCQQGCPIHTNIPEVIRLLKDNHLDDCLLYTSRQRQCRGIQCHLYYLVFCTPARPVQPCRSASLYYK